LRCSSAAASACCCSSTSSGTLSAELSHGGGSGAPHSPPPERPAHMRACWAQSKGPAGRHHSSRHHLLGGGRDRQQGLRLGRCRCLRHWPLAGGAAAVEDGVVLGVDPCGRPALLLHQRRLPVGAEDAQRVQLLACRGQEGVRVRFPASCGVSLPPTRAQRAQRCQARRTATSLPAHGRLRRGARRVRTHCLPAAPRVPPGALHGLLAADGVAAGGPPACVSCMRELRASMRPAGVPRPPTPTPTPTLQHPRLRPGGSRRAPQPPEQRGPT
jgi:hypothetical protein